MTRDEAVKKLKAVRCPDATFKQTISAHFFVDGLVALGLLNLGEPKSPNEDLREGVQDAPLGLVSWDELATILAERSLKVVRA